MTKNVPVLRTETPSVTVLEADTTTLEDAFPDANFRTYVAVTVLKITTDADYNDETVKTNTLTSTHISTIGTQKTIDVNGRSITSLAGVEHFTALTSLKCHNNQLASLDVSNNTALKTLYCYTNLLGSLNVTANNALENLRCYSNQLTSLSLPNTITLSTLYCYNNQLDELDVSNNTALTDLRCNDNQLTSLDVSTNTGLTGLRCYNNQLTSLDVTTNIALTYLHVKGNLLKELNVTANTNLEDLICNNNRLTSLSLPNTSTLTTLNCCVNQLDSLDISNNKGLTNLDCHSNLLSGTLDLNKMNDLTSISVSGNPLSALVISDDAKPNITSLNYRTTNIAIMDLTDFTTLTYLAVTKSTNAMNLSQVTELFVSGSNGWDYLSLVRLAGDAGAFSWDEKTGYYVVAPDKNVAYGFTVYCAEEDDGYVNMPSSQYIPLSNGGLVDDEGNLVVGATLSNVADDGTITLPNGGVIATPEGTYEFDGAVSIKDGQIRTEANFTYSENTATYDPETKTGTITDPIVIQTEIVDGEAVINSVGGGTVIVPPGSEVTFNGDDTATVEFPEGGSVTVPVGSTVTEGEAAGTIEVELPDGGTVIVPDGSTVTEGDDEGTIKVELPDDGGTVIVPDGSTVNEDGSVTYAVSQQFGTWTGTGSVSARVNAGGAEVTGLTNGTTDVAFEWETASDGSTVITLTRSYLGTLSNRSYTFIAQFGNSNGRSAPITLTVNVAAPAPQPPAPSSDATLKSLTISPGALSLYFTPGVTSYTANVANSVPSVSVSATPTDANARVSVTGATSLQVGANTITVTVTAEDGVATQTYTIVVTRAAADSSAAGGNSDSGSSAANTGGSSGTASGNSSGTASGGANARGSSGGSNIANAGTVSAAGQNAAGGSAAETGAEINDADTPLSGPDSANGGSPGGTEPGTGTNVKTLDDGMIPLDNATDTVTTESNSLRVILPAVGAAIAAALLAALIVSLLRRRNRERAN
jgi:hypothetical protein